MANKYLRIIENFRNRNISVEFFSNLNDIKNRILELVPLDSSVGVGNSQTLKKMNISNLLVNRGNVVFDNTIVNDRKESKILKKKSLLSDWYITGTNAISEEGHIVNIDHSGNRVAAMTYGPDKVIIVIGKNKIEETLDKAIKRARNHAAPLNAIRAGYRPPCVALKECVDCKSRERVCYHLSIIEGQFDPNRMLLFICNEEIGF